jgi:8-oxo-dGTP pyrophosphatase MutT (NUDIX family)
VSDGPEQARGFRHLRDEPIATLARSRVVRAVFQAPDGSTFERDVVRTQRVVAMVPLSDDGASALLVRQYRGPIDAQLLEIPAGLCDVDGEDPLETAARELEEEVGRKAAQLELIARIHPAAGFTDQFTRLYLATGLTDVGDSRQGVEEEHMTSEWVALDDVPRMIADGDLTDSKSMIGLLLALRRHEGR